MKIRLHSVCTKWKQIICHRIWPKVLLPNRCDICAGQSEGKKPLN